MPPASLYVLQMCLEKTKRNYIYYPVETLHKCIIHNVNNFHKTFAKCMRDVSRKSYTVKPHLMDTRTPQYNGQILGPECFPLTSIQSLHIGNPTIMDKICGSKLSALEGFHCYLLPCINLTEVYIISVEHVPNAASPESGGPDES